MPAFHFGKGIRIACLWVCMVLTSACQPGFIPIHPTPTPDQPQPIEYNGKGAAHITFRPWVGPAIMHITSQGDSSFKASLSMGLDLQELVNAGGSVDEYRGYEFSPNGEAELVIQGDQPWSVTILPVTSRYFPSLKIPGQYQGQGSAVILLDGEYGVATFDIADFHEITAWAFGPGGVGEKLAIKPPGDYQGKTVLPRSAGWLVVSARGAWSVDVQAPCCTEPK